MSRIIRTCGRRLTPSPLRPSTFLCYLNLPQIYLQLSFPNLLCVLAELNGHEA